MEIKINGKPADITLENEKTVGEVLSGIQTWLESTGFSVSGLEIDSKSYGSLSLESAFSLSLEGLSSIDIQTSGWADLFLEALTSLLKDLELYDKTEPEDQKNFREHWSLSAPALFLKDHDTNLYNAVLNAINNSDVMNITGTIPVILERIREIKNPVEEMNAIHPLADEIAKRLEDIPLDMQTGKDGKAAETITVFSSLVEKIFRLIFLFKYFKTDIDSIEVLSVNSQENQNLKDYLGDFSTALKELISAYESKDTILVGDLAEYELAPRLRCLTEVLCMKVKL